MKIHALCNDPICMSPYGEKKGTVVDGSEILRSPVEVGSLSHYLQGFKQIPGGDRRIFSINRMSTGM